MLGDDIQEMMVSLVKKGREKISDGQDGNSEPLHIHQPFDDTVETLKIALQGSCPYSRQSNTYDEGETPKLEAP